MPATDERVLVCVRRRHLSIHTYVLPRLRLLSSPSVSVSFPLPLSSHHPLEPFSLSCKDSHVLAPSTYVQEQIADPVHSRYWHWTVPLRQVFGRVESNPRR